MQKQKALRLTGSEKLQWLFNIVFAGLFGIVALLVVFHNRNTLHEFRWYWLLLGFVVGPFVFWGLHKLAMRLPRIDASTERLLYGMALFVFFLLQLYVGWNLRVATDDRWDFGIVYGSAAEYVNTGTMRPDVYFQWFPNNTGLYLFFCLFLTPFQWLGMSDFAVPTMVLNVLVIDAAILLLVLCVRTLLGRKKAAFTLFCAFCCLPFTLYVPIYYTDTLTLAFPIGAVYLWLKARAHWRAGRIPPAVRRFIGLSVLVAFGAVLKFTVVIIWVAIAIDLLLQLKGRLKYAMLGGGLAALLVLYLLGSWYAKHAYCLPVYNYNESIPFTHWVMMGLYPGRYGSFYDPDYQLTLSYPDMASRYAFTLEETGRRISDMGFLGLLGHLGDKLAYIFDDPTFYAPEKLDRGPVEIGYLHQFVTPGGKWFPLMLYMAFPLQGALICGMLVSALKSVFSRNNCLTFCRIAVFGLVLFMLGWEARSRYLVNYLPVMLLCAIEALPQPRKKIRPGELIYEPVKETEPEKTIKKAKPEKPKKKLKKAEQEPYVDEPVEQMDLQLRNLDDKTDKKEKQVPASLFTQRAESPKRPTLFNLFGDEAEYGKEEREPQADELFDVPSGDPFFELARTSGWDVEHLLEKQGEQNE